jgi:3-hydroxyacyl-CoA dehydrogenase/3-hydroxy-2-methylbutyryl-CoA dehydrogenase
MNENSENREYHHYDEESRITTNNDTTILSSRECQIQFQILTSHLPFMIGISFTLQIYFWSRNLSMLSSVVGIVSGGSSGLGAATVRCLLRSGARVVVADLPNSRDNFFQMAQAEGIDSSKIVDGAPGISAAGSPVLAFAETDVTRPEQVEWALDLAEAAFGEHVNAAVSCAGIGIAKKTLSRKRGSEDPPSAHPLELFSNVIKVNLLGTFNLASLAAERMARREPGKDGARGCIVNTASVAAYDGQRGQVAYAASKGGVVGLTLPMARDLAEHGIRVMTIVSSIHSLQSSLQSCG